VLVPIVLAVTLATVAALLVLMLALLRHLKRLAASVAMFSREVQPVLEEIQRQSLDAQGRLDRLSQRRDAPIPPRAASAGGAGTAEREN
jgi:hypothetical protein